VGSQAAVQENPASPAVQDNPAKGAVLFAIIGFLISLIGFVFFNSRFFTTEQCVIELNIIMPIVGICSLAGLSLGVFALSKCLKAKKSGVKARLGFIISGLAIWQCLAHILTAFMLVAFIGGAVCGELDCYSCYQRWEQ
jgi:hypothetical protein